MSSSARLFAEYRRRPTAEALKPLLEEHAGALYGICLRVLGHPPRMTSGVPKAGGACKNRIFPRNAFRNSEGAWSRRARASGS